MAVVKLPLQVRWSIRAGSDFAATYQWVADGTAPDLSGWDARLVARSYVGARTELVDWDVTDGHITLGADGSVRIEAPGEETVDFKWSEAVADLDLVAHNGAKVPFLRAHISVSPAVIR